ncbi:MAG: GTPase [Candidatus Micrarchaeota archaeon]|nr:GTPase [Candidatus Micrarchaeota archaeon]MDE1859080.1 GTPase [Candidatus Micrarchaeota archaeon]
MERKKIVIIGAAGRDFHNFNVLFRNAPGYEVVAFTAAQIPYISNKDYPKELSGKLYPKGIHIYDESELPRLIKELSVDACILAYSDLRYEDVMHKASLVNACGADFWLVAPRSAMIKSSKPVIGVCGVRTGVGKSQTSRYIAKFLKRAGLRVAVIRHPMPYGVLKDQIVERFSKLSDLDKYKTTIEEREDYEPHIKNGFVVYAGVDYGKILEKAEKEADVILWDGGNNDASFYKTDMLIVVADPLRAGNELTYYPGETVARMADILLINKVNSARPEEVERVREDLSKINPKARIILGKSEVLVDNPRLIKGKRVLLVEDGPTITHGNMAFGAATVAAQQFGAGEIVEARKYAVGAIKDTFAKYPSLKTELPAMGYSPKQIRDLEATINAADCDCVVSATPTDLKRLISPNKPIVQVTYELVPVGRELDAKLEAFVKSIKR